MISCIRSGNGEGPRFWCSDVFVSNLYLSFPSSVVGQWFEVYSRQLKKGGKTQYELLPLLISFFMPPFNNYPNHASWHCAWTWCSSQNCCLQATVSTELLATESAPREDNYKEKHIIAPAWGGKWGKQGRNEAIATLQEGCCSSNATGQTYGAQVDIRSEISSIPMHFLSHNLTNLEHHFFANVSSSSRGNHDKGSHRVRKVQFFWTLFKRHLTPPPFRLNIMWWIFLKES